MGLQEGQGKDYPWPWLFQPLYPWLKERRVSQISSVSWEITRAERQGTGVPAPWRGPRNPDSKASPATHSL